MRILARTLRFVLCLTAFACLAGTRPASGQSAAGPTWPPLEQDARLRPDAPPADSLLAPWQRDFARRTGHREPTGASSDLAPSVTLTAPPTSPGAWRELAVPTGREGQSAIYDPLRGRVILFGGWDGGQYRSDVWTLSLTGPPALSLLATGGDRPPGRVGQSAIYDPVRDRILVFGGFTDEAPARFLDDVWELSLSGTPAWSLITPVSDGPAARAFQSAVYDSDHDRMVVFGGTFGTTTPQYLNDVWALTFADSTAWVRLAPGGTSPGGRDAHAAFYDPAGDAMVVFGGYAYSGSSRYLNDAWQLSFGADTSWWNPIPAAGTPPPGRAGHSLVWDVARSRLVVFGGDSWDGSYHFLADAWALSLGQDPAWTPITAPAGPAARSGQAAIYDPTHDGLLVVGGYFFDGAYDFYCDAWALSLSGTPAWSAWAPAGQPPQARDQMASVLDPVNSQLVVFGGYFNDGAPHYLGDTWALSLSDPPGWTEIAAAGTPPASRIGHSAIFDPVRSRMLVFGGYYYAAGYHYLNDVWALSLTGTPTWTQLAPGGSAPPARSGQVTVYDPVRDQMIVFGGYSFDGVYHYYDDVWTLSLGGTPAWSQLAPAGPLPSPRSGHAGIYDPVRDRLVILGGYDYDGTSHYLADAWALSLAGSPAWAQVARGGAWPGPRAGHAAAYDPVGDRLWIVGGYTYDTAPRTLNDSWALALAGDSPWWPPVQAATPMPGRSGHACAWDPSSGRAVVFGGMHVGPSYLQDVWTLTSASTVSEPGGESAPGFALGPIRPTPSRGGTAVSFELPRPASVLLRIVDVSGRLVATPQSGFLAAGPHEARWDGRDREGRSVPAGVYFCELRAGREHLTRRLVLMR